MKARNLVFGFIFLNLFLFCSESYANTTYTLGVEVDSQNTLKVTILDDLLEGSDKAWLANVYDVGDTFTLEVKDIEEEVVEMIFYTINGEISSIWSYEIWSVELNQALSPFTTSKYSDVLKEPYSIHFLSVICPLPVNEYLTEVAEYQNYNLSPDWPETIVTDNTITYPGHDLANAFVPTFEVSYEPSTGWLRFWRYKKDDIVILEMVSETYPVIPGYHITVFLAFIIIFTFGLVDLTMRKKKISGVFFD